MGCFLSYKNDADIEKGLMALAGAQTPKEAVEFLKSEYAITTKEDHLLALARFRPERYAELRERIAPLKEKTLIHNLQGNALYASEVTRIGMEQLMEMMEAGKIEPQYLSRVARDVADVQAKSIDKMLALEGRPTGIVEHRTPGQIISALERMKVLKTVQVIGPGAEVLEEVAGGEPARG